MIGDPTAEFSYALRDLQETDLALPETWDPQLQALLNNDAILKRAVDRLLNPGLMLGLTGGDDRRVLYVKSDGTCANFDPVTASAPIASFVKVDGAYYGPNNYAPVGNLQMETAYFAGADGVLTTIPPTQGERIFVGVAASPTHLQVRLLPLYRR